MIAPPWVTEYRAERCAVVAANAGDRAISVVALLPNAPQGIWSQVSTTIRTLKSPTNFLSNLYCELVSLGHAAIAEERLSLDGFLGSAFSSQDPNLLVPAISLWIQSPAEVDSTVESIFRIVGLWETLLGRPIRFNPFSMQPATALGPFLPHARVPRKGLVDSFEQAVRSRFDAQRSNDR